MDHPNPGTSRQSQGASAPGSGATQHIISIPSFREVQQAERAPPPNLFRPGGAGAAALPVPVAAAPSYNALAFLDGAGAAGHGAGEAASGSGQGAAGPSYSHHPSQQQRQQAAWAAPPAPRPPAPPPQQYPYQQQQDPQHQQHQQQQQRPAVPPQAAQRPLPAAHNHPPQQHRHQPPPQQQLAFNPNPNPNPNAILVSRRQEGNPVLRHVRNVRWAYADDIVPDYVLGASTAALFLSLRYHLLRPDYIHARLKELGRAYRLRVVLVCVDSEDAAAALAQVRLHIVTTHSLLTHAGRSA